MTHRTDDHGQRSTQRLRIDKWLWAARFFKTRTLAAQAVNLGRVRAGGERVKPAHAVRVGETIEVQLGESRIDVVVVALSDVRGPAPQAQLLYEETPASAARQLAREQARRVRGRPTKREGRALRRLNEA